MKILVAGYLSLVALGVHAQTGPIKIGEINSYSSMPQFTAPYRQGWQLAVNPAQLRGDVQHRRPASSDEGRSVYLGLWMISEAGFDARMHG